MSTIWKWKSIGTLAAVLLSVYLLIPSLFDFQERFESADRGGSQQPAWAKFFPDSALNLGLDLRGGMYLEMEVDLEDALRTHLDLLITQIERLAEDKEFPGLVLKPGNSKHSLRVELAAEHKAAFLDIIRDNIVDSEDFSRRTIFNETVIQLTDGVGFELVLNQEYIQGYQKRVLRQAEGAVTKRIDRFGVAEASIQRQGDDRLIIELPGVKNPDRVVDVIRKTGRLEFKLLDETADFATLTALANEARTKLGIDAKDFSRNAVEKISAEIKDQIPEGSGLLYSVERDPLTKEVTGGTLYVVKQRAEITGDMLQNASVGISDNEPHVRLSFNRTGARNFAKVTQENVNRRFAIILDDIVSSAPVIQEPILNGEARITLGYGGYETLKREAEDLALLLREGALPARLSIATKTIIGPSLGLESIKMGLNSMLIAAIVIIIFMILYYKVGGLISTIALALNILFIFSILAVLQASLTLPGMAGIVLTLGMAVDANIIVFERMREERRLGKSAQSIIESGYGNAMSSIVDANVTTLFAGIVLYQFGTGPVKGFATTLMVGIVTTMFTAIVVTRLIYDYLVFKVKISKVSI